jgi:hypothetical protein
VSLIPDQRPPAPTVTKEAHRMNTLTRFPSRLGVVGQSRAEALGAEPHARTPESVRKISGGAPVRGREQRTCGSHVRGLRTLRRAAYAVVSVVLIGAGAFVMAAPAQAAPSPWWKIQSGSRPSSLEPGGQGDIVLYVENIGDADADSLAEPIKITDQLPPGLTVEGASMGLSIGNVASFAPCEISPTLTCTWGGFGHEEKLGQFQILEVRIRVSVAANAISGEPNSVSVSGGGAAPAGLTQATRLGGQPTFGVQGTTFALEEEGGSDATQAGSRPFQLTNTIVFNQLADPKPLTDLPFVEPAGMVKDLHFQLPPGLIGNANAMPQCSETQFYNRPNVEVGAENECPADTAIGVATVNLFEPALSSINFTVPVFNLEPARGEPARFGFYILAASTPIVIDTAIRSDSDYGVTASVTNTPQTAGVLASNVTFWGVPGDPRHDQVRGWQCLEEDHGEIFGGHCRAEDDETPTPFLQTGTSCTGAPSFVPILGDSWEAPTLEENFTPERPLAPLDGCNRVPFGPQIASEPTANSATSPTGLNFDIDVNDEGQKNAKGLVQSQIKKTVVSLPQGFTANPSVAEGLKACSEAEYKAATVVEGTGCTVHGSLYVARQGENPNGNLLTLYLVARNEEIGVLVKQALKVTPNPVTGQLTTEADDIPQLPFSRFHLSFRQGQRAPLVTPPACGTYTVGADLYPYSNPEAALHRESSFKITSGPEGQGCPSGGVPPFHPGLEAGTQNNAAGSYSPFYTHITRKDSEQEITRFSIKLPTGVIAKLKGVSECSDAQIAQAKSREVEGGGTVEQEHPSCPANSEIGHSLVGTGVGNVLAYAPGKLYLAGPYHGSPISLVSITAAKVGPFDLGTVVVRFALDVNHETAEVSVDGANSDPIPHIVDGIPVHLRDIRAYVSRPDFTLNPTSCAKKSTASTILGSGLNFASSSDDVPVTVSSPFQAADCASLGFAPKLALSLTGKKTHRGALPAFKAVLTYPKGGAYANIAKAQVTLPSSEILEQGHLKNVCTRKVFETGNTPGENCPKNSIYGTARAVTPLLDQPLEGPVYLRTGYGTKLPELAAALNGPQISVTLAGKIDSVHQKGSEISRIRNTFEAVPDAPVERFVLELKGAKKGLLVNSTDVCKGTHKALAAFTGQNGKLDEYEPALKAQCGKGKKKSGAKKKSKGGAK